MSSLQCPAPAAQSSYNRGPMSHGHAESVHPLDLDRFEAAGASITPLSAADMRDALHGKVVILMGYPGAGKGTQAKMLERYLAVGGAPYPHLSTGELFRDEVDADTPVGRQMQAAMLAGVPISDTVVFPYLRDKLSRPPYHNGFILDGFPKNVSSFEFIISCLQALHLAPLSVIHIDLPRSEVEQRLTLRLHCRLCSKDYQSTDFAQGVTPHCDACAGPLAQRDDDKQAAIVKRLDTFDTYTTPLLARFAQRYALHSLRVVGPTAAAQKVFLQQAIRCAISQDAVAGLPQASYHLGNPPTLARSSVFHNHVDARNPWVLTQILQEAQRVVPATQNRVYPVAQLVLGPQVGDLHLACIYRNLPNFHPIATSGGAAVEAFSTGNMGDVGFDYAQILATLQSAYAHPGQGVMTELEEEIYEVAMDPAGAVRTTLDRGFTPAQVDWDALAPWRAHAMANPPTFEMHHAVDLAKMPGEAAPPFALAALMHATEAAAFNLGGWFLFAKDDRWALRSNEFTSAPYAQTRMRLDTQAQILRQCVAALMPPGDTRRVSSRASLEKVHAIWRVT